jgi:hypothetical protein
MSNVNELAELEQKMTTTHGGVSPGARMAFDRLYQQFGFDGVKAMHDAGYDGPEKVWDFFLKCHESVSEMAAQLNLN